MVHKTQWHLSPLWSRHLGTSHSSSNHHQLSCIFLNLTDGLISLPFQRWFQFWEKPEVSGHQIWAVGGPNHVGGLMFRQKNSARDVMHEQACCRDEAANHQWPIAAASWIVWIVSVEGYSSLMQNLMQIHCSTCSVTLNAVATQDTCSLNNVYHSPWLVQWSCHCSHMHLPVHSPCCQLMLMSCKPSSLY